MLDILFAKIKEDAKIPSKRKEDMGYDVYACFPENEVVILPHETKMIPTGIVSAIPKGYGMLLEERGSTGSQGIKRSAGVIDEGFRDEWFVALTNTNTYPVVITKSVAKVTMEEGWDGFAGKTLLYPYSKAIVQGLLIEVPESRSVEVSLEEILKHTSERGTGKLGSSGK